MKLTDPLSVALLALFIPFVTFAAPPQIATSTPTVAELVQQIQELRAQLEVMRVELASTKQELAVVKEEIRITKTLKLGMADAEVKALQEFLKTLPEIYPEGLVTGYYGPLTQAAVKRLQASWGIESVGIVGPKTRAKLSETTAVSSSGGGSSASANSNAGGNGLAIGLNASSTPPGLENHPTTTPSGTTPATPAVPSSGGGGGGGATPAVPATPTASSTGTTTPPVTPPPPPPAPITVTNPRSGTIYPKEYQVTFDAYGIINFGLKLFKGPSVVFESTTAFSLTSPMTYPSGHSFSLREQSPNRFDIQIAPHLVTTVLSGNDYKIRVYNWDNRAVYDDSETYTIDATPPAISNVMATSITSDSAIITYTTDEPSGQSVNFGSTPTNWTSAGGYNGIGSPTFTTSHSIALSNLQSNTQYTYRVYSNDAVGNSAQTDPIYTFTTLPPPACDSDTVNDGDGNAYSTVSIGTQCWMKENIRVGAMLLSGATIPSDNNIIEKWCYDNDNAICGTEGGLYTWSEALQIDPANNTAAYTPSINHRGICPVGWHIPTDAEWKTLERQLGMTNGDADSVGWRGSPIGSNLQVNGTSEFNVILAGDQFSGAFHDRTFNAKFWTSSEYDTVNALDRAFSNSFDTVYRDYQRKVEGNSVRCLKN